MSVFKHPKTPFYQYDFQLRGHRFHGSTGATSKAEALKFEKAKKEAAKVDLDALARSGNAPLTIGTAFTRYWNEVGQRHANSATTWTDLGRLQTYFGQDRRLDTITDDDVAKLVTWRAGQTLRGKKSTKDQPVALVSPATVNRSTTLVLKKVFTRARRTWRFAFPNEPQWKDHRLKEPEERVRELHEGEGERLTNAARDDFKPWLEFASLTGLRRAETLIKWSAVNWQSKTIRTLGKGERWVSTPITPDVEAVLLPLKGHDPVWVFTYVCRRPREGQVKGQRYPLTVESVKSQWRRLRKRAKVEDFRFHDLRHDVATKLLRDTGNLKLVQKALNHRRIETTTKYAHVLDGELAAALQAVSQSRNKSRSEIKEGA